MGQAKEIRVAPISRRDADALIIRQHYSHKTVQNAYLALGVFLDGRLEGAMTFGPSMDKSNVQGLVRDTIRCAHHQPESPDEMGPLIHREDLIDFETHDAVAFARYRREPRSVDLDPASLLRPDRSARAQIAHQERHRRSSHAEYLRQRLLGEREDVVVEAVAKLEQPASHAGLDRVQRIAGRAELELYQHRTGVLLDGVPDRRAAVEGGVKSRCRDPRGGARRMYDRGSGRG
jgi:hypothetical protein